MTTSLDEQQAGVPGLAGAPTSRRTAGQVSGRTAGRVVAGWAASGGWPVVVYCASRLLLLIVAGADVLITHRSLGSELSLFDGGWYLRLAREGYPSRALPAQSTLGFLPAYPLLMIAVSRLLALPLAVAGRLISFCGGLAAAIGVQRLASAWWGERTAGRAVLVFCLFPGSSVFSMVYSEGLTVPLVLGCLLALRTRRWALAGCLAGLAGVTEPAALILIPVCLAAAVRQAVSAGWRDRPARAGLLAPLLAPLLASAGIAVFAVFLWAWTGTPFATYQAQSDGWHNGLLTVLSQPLTRQLAGYPAGLTSYLGNLSLWNGVLGTVFLGFALHALWRHRRELSTGALGWTCGIGAVTLWSLMTLPSARMLLVACPAVLIWARCLPRRRLRLFLVIETALFILTGGLTFAGLMLP